MYTRKNACLRIAAGFAVAALASLPHLSPADPIPASKLIAAKTIQVHEAILTQGKNRELTPTYDIDVRITRPSAVNAVIQETGLKVPHQYVGDGKTEKEYNAKDNTTRSLTPSKSGVSHSNYRRIAQLDLILASGELPTPKPDVKRTITKETRDNIPMTVTTDTMPPQISPNGETFTNSQKLWVVTATGLPYRYESAYTIQEKTTISQVVTFSDWRFNQPLSSAQMAFTPPASAKPYVAPPMPTFETLPVGTVAPDFAAVTPDGKTVKLSDYRGKVVILDFWATWCHPCQEAMPHLNSVYNQVKDQDVVVLALCVWDSKPGYDKWVVDKKSVYVFPTAYDPAGRDNDKSIASTLYKMNAIPTQYVIGKDGKIAAGYVGDEGHQLEKALAALGVTVKAEEKAVVIAP